MYNFLKNINKGFIAALVLLIACQNANAGPLEGRWQHNGQSTSVRPNYNQGFLFCNEQGDCAEGKFRGPRLVFVPRWNVTGVINRNLNIISWSNGTQWTRFNRPGNEIRVQIGGRGAVAGPWLHEGKATSIQLERDGAHFTIINELGQPTQGYFNGNGEMVLPALNTIGRLNKNGGVIQWSNGTTWYRP